MIGNAFKISVKSFLAPCFFSLNVMPVIRKRSHAYIFLFPASVCMLVFVLSFEYRAKSLEPLILLNLS